MHLNVALSGLAFITGAVIGSFLNVVIYRLPVGKSIISPSSYCPECEAPIKPWHNVPILSYFILRGRCRSCGAEIPLRYPLIETISAISFLIIFLSKGLETRAIYLYLLFPFLIAASAIDIEHRKIPNNLLLPVLVFAVSLMAITNFDRWKEIIISAFAAALFLLLVALVRPGGMGMGDVKFIFVLGIFLGKFVFEALALGILVAGVTSIVLLLTARKGRKEAIPFGPYLALGAGISALWGEAIWLWYFSIFR